jgi:hypothetical protein
LDLFSLGVDGFQARGLPVAASDCLALVKVDLAFFLVITGGTARIIHSVFPVGSSLRHILKLNV